MEGEVRGMYRDNPQPELPENQPPATEDSNSLPAGFLLWQETILFVIVSVLDALMTWHLLTHDGAAFVESNPVARYFIYGWGLKGMVGFKLTLVIIVAAICQWIARLN